MSGPPSFKLLRDEMRSVRSAVAALAAELRVLQTQSAQLAALREDEAAVAAQLEQLEAVLVQDRVAAHCRDAISRAPIADVPVPHAVIDDLLPAETYATVIRTLPSPVFFEGRDDTRRQVAVPPKLAGVAAIVAWRFVADLVFEVLAPALVARFEGPLLRHVQRFVPEATAWPVEGRGVTPSLGRLLRRERGAAAQPRRERPRHFLTSVLFLARPGDTIDYGSVLHGPDGSAALTVPFRPNTLLTAMDASGAHDYEAIPTDAPADVARHTYEFPIGPQGWDPGPLPLRSDR